MAKRKLIEWKLDDPEHVVKFLSLVKSPAIQVNWKAFSGDDVSFRTVDEEKRMLAGPVMIPDLPIFRRLEGKEEVDVFFSTETIETVAKKFFKSKSVLNLDEEHTNRRVPAFVLESWFISDPETDKSAALGFSDLPRGTWFVIAHVEDEEFWKEKVKTGLVRGFSVELSGYESIETQMSKKFNTNVWKTVNGEMLTTADDSSEMMVGASVKVQAEDGSLSDPTDGTYELDNGDTVTVEGGSVVEIRKKQDEVAAQAEESMALTPEDIAAVMAEVQPMLDALREETASMLADMATRLAALEASMSEQAASTEEALKAAEEKLSATETKLQETEEELKKFASSVPGTEPATKGSPNKKTDVKEAMVSNMVDFIFRDKNK